MKYTPEEVMQFVQEEDVKFIRLAFCNVYGKQHNVAIMPAELKRAFTYGIAFDASAVEGFGGEIRSDLLLHYRRQRCNCAGQCNDRANHRNAKGAERNQPHHYTPFRQNF